MTQQHKHIIELLQEFQITRHNKIYSAQIFVPIIQRYYEEIYPNKFRIAVFQRIGSYKPIILTGD
jgi:hypothetical protein